MISSGMFNLGPAGCIYPRIAVTVAKYQIFNLLRLRTLWDFCNLKKKMYLDWMLLEHRFRRWHVTRSEVRLACKPASRKHKDEVRPQTISASRGRGSSAVQLDVMEGEGRAQGWCPAFSQSRCRVISSTCFLTSGTQGSKAASLSQIQPQ